MYEALWAAVGPWLFAGRLRPQRVQRGIFGEPGGCELVVHACAIFGLAI